MAEDAESEVERTELADLVRERLAEIGLSARRLADACIDPRYPDREPAWKRGTLLNLLAGRVILTPGPGELRALAEGLRLPLRAVQAAAVAQFFDIDDLWDEDSDARLMVHSYRSLSPENRARARELLKVWAEPDRK